MARDQARDIDARLPDKPSSLPELHKCAFQTVASKDEWKRWGYQMVVGQKATDPDPWFRWCRGSRGAEAALRSKHPV